MEFVTEINIICNICGKDLTAGMCGIEIAVDPCKDCLDDQVSDGYDNGYSEGMSDGYEEGRASNE